MSIGELTEITSTDFIDSTFSENPSPESPQITHPMENQVAYSNAGQRRLRTETQTPQVNIQNIVQVNSNTISSSEANELAEILRKYAPPRPEHGGRTIYQAATAGDERAVRLLIKHKADQGADRKVTLGCAIRSKSLPLVKYLVEEEKYVSETVFQDCMLYDFFDGVDYFLEKGLKLPTNIIILSLHGAYTAKTNMERINFLLSRGATTACIENAPETLYIAFITDDLILSQFLLDNKVLSKIHEHPKESHLIFIIFRINLTIDDKKINNLRILFNKGMKLYPASDKEIWEKFIESFNRHWPTIGTKLQKLSLLKLLIENGLSMDKNHLPFSESVIQYAILNFPDLELIETMLKHGADPNYKGSRESPLQMARKLGNGQLVSLLIRYGAELIDV